MNFWSRTERLHVTGMREGVSERAEGSRDRQMHGLQSTLREGGMKRAPRPALWTPACARRPRYTG